VEKHNKVHIWKLEGNEKSMVDRKSLYWWKDLCLICEVDKEFNWFDKRIKWKHGN